MSALSDLINYMMDVVRKSIEKCLKNSLPFYAIPSVYSTAGLAILIIIPSAVFTNLEGTDKIIGTPGGQVEETKMK